MTTQELINYYADLLILQYRGKPKAYATIQTQVTPILMPIDGDPTTTLPLAVQNAYNLLGPNPAVGVQLDVLGKYAGVTRSGNGFSGPITLDDADFLTLIQIAIIRNNAGSSLATIQALLFQFFPLQILVFDTQNMQMSYFISTAFGSYDLVQLVVSEGLLPRPMGVQLAAIIYGPDVTHFFGFRTYQAAGYNVEPLNNYTSYQTDWPWLSYTDAVIV